MQVYATLLAFAVILVASIESRPSWPSVYVSSYRYPSETIALHPHLLEYQSAPYYVYNVHTGVNTVTTTVLTEDKSPAYTFYYGTPVYDVRLSPLYPVSKSGKPELPKTTPPTEMTTTTMAPVGDSGEGVEKLDTRTEPKKSKTVGSPASMGSKEDDDSITVDSI